MSDAITQTQYDPTRGEAARAVVGQAGDRGKAAILLADDAKYALLTQLFRAEMLAEKAGFGAGFSGPQGQTGYILSGATAKAQQIGTGNEAARIYLATQAHAQMTIREMTRVPLATPASFDPETYPEQMPVVAPVVVLAVVACVAVAAAVAAVAWSSMEKVRIEKEATMRSNAVDTAYALAMSGKPVDPKVYDLLGKMAGDGNSLGGGSITDMLWKGGLILGTIWAVNETGILRKLFR